VYVAWRQRARQTAATPLMAAASRGDAKAVEQLLHLGADVNARGRRRRTALFEAAVAGHGDCVAALLAHGADPDLGDWRGRKPLSTDVVSLETLHGFRQRYHRHAVAPSASSPPSGQACAWAGELERHGILKISGLVGAEALARMRVDIARFVTGIEARLARGVGEFRHYDEEEHYWVKDRAYVSNNAFKYSADLLALACHRELLDAAHLYVGKQPHIQRGVAMRYLPSQETSNDMFGWHHDMEEKRFKVMVLLSDVCPEDQHMSYALGSHRPYHPYKMFFRNKCGLDYCRRHQPELSIFDAVGRAGDLFVFDSNGAHRGTRRPTGGVRDVFLFELSADKSEVWGGDVDRALLERISRGDGHPFGPMLATRPKWTQPVTRTHPSWVENLPHLERWL
jgi:hypothetical protein